MILYKTSRGGLVTSGGDVSSIPIVDWDRFINRDDLSHHLEKKLNRDATFHTEKTWENDLYPPIGDQEVWAAGVTYYRSREARVEESESSGGANFYEAVYWADRPELFHKATAHRVVGHRGVMQLRPDATWIVPEPELTLLISSNAKIIGYTIGNDLSCRDMEGINPLYLPQAKTYDRCAALGPGIFVSDQPLSVKTIIEMKIYRGDRLVFADATEISRMKKDLSNLVAYLFKACSFPKGCFLMTGTGIVPPMDFSLCPADEIHITIEPIGTLVNTVA